MKIRKSEGGGYERRGVHYARVTIATGEPRKSVALPWCNHLPDAKARGVVLQALINDLRAWAQASTKEETKASLTDLLHRAQEIIGNP